MSGGRERDVTEALVSLASSLASGEDVLDLLGELTGTCARLLDVASGGLLLADSQGQLHVIAASSDRTLDLEVLQLQGDEGPCVDCYRTAAPVLVPDLAAADDRWPTFVPAALDAGFASVHALPLRLRRTTLGALGLFGTTTGALNDDDLRLGQALADVASVALVQDEVAADHAAIGQQLQAALDSRVVLEQAKGVLAQQGQLDMTRAFQVLRRYARDHDQRLADLAAAVATRALPAQQLLEHARSRGVLRT